MEKTLRLFIAVPIPLAQRERLSDIGHHLKKRVHPPAKRWLYRDDYHITMQFLGDVHTDLLSSICECLEEFSTMYEPFKLEMTRPVLFPSLRHPLVIACPLQPNAVLERAATNLSRLLTQFGFSEITLPFRGHVTLARIISHNPPRIPFLGMENIEMIASSFAIYQSISTPNQGPHYRILREYKLSKVSV